ncbi:Uu.00g100490.m01.CDS01 [Anthostomella pinea]|uniref:Uu.00g100490.m01.CDS01 n=1 Tax=Anthostomella pinea TaxID=933095 RepID=A0AAI8VD12_9PEZI|nr:Uu.00g100490.m01.CDS01 [Anthostomella pinea]
MTIASILTPHWVSYSVTADNTGSTFTKHIGLHTSCSSVDEPSCRPFPTDDDCRDDKFFCSMWRSSGFLLSFATIVELATLITFLVVMAGGKYKREMGWKLIGGFLMADAVVEFASMGIVAYLFDNDSQFAIPGWELDWSFVLCTISASVSVLIAASLAASAWVLPPEDDYEYLDDPEDPFDA